METSLVQLVLAEPHQQREDLAVRGLGVGVLEVVPALDDDFPGFR